MAVLKIGEEDQPLHGGGPESRISRNVLLFPLILACTVLAVGVPLIATWNCRAASDDPLRDTAVTKASACERDQYVVSRVASGPPDFASVASHSPGLPSFLLPKDFVSFAKILQESGSAKKTHFYGPMYAEYLDPLRLHGQPINMLEIGLFGGASLDMWLKAFPQGKIYGLEYNYKHFKETADVSKEHARVKYFGGDQANVTLLKEMSEEIRAEVGTLDMIVDDGGHTMEQQITSFTHLMPLLRPGGLYFIEDLQTSYYEKFCFHQWDGTPYCYGGGPPGKKNTAIDLIKSMIDVLNNDFMEDHEGRDKIASGVYHVNPADQYVGSLQCWRNMCVFRKKFENSYF